MENITEIKSLNYQFLDEKREPGEHTFKDISQQILSERKEAVNLSIQSTKHVPG